MGGVEENHIIEIVLGDRVNVELSHPDRILDDIGERIKDNNRYYVLLDEVQMIEDFPEVMNNLLHIRNVDTYVTESNSRFLSKDVVTEFRGRGQDIHM